MSEERHIFRNWLVSHTGTLANVSNATTRRTYQEIQPPNLGEKFEGIPQFLEACAKVRYRARFADKAGTVAYLADCESREELDAAELDEVMKLRDGQGSRKKNGASNAARFENDFSVAVIQQAEGETLRLTIEPELRTFVKRISEANGQMPRTELRKGKSDSYQPEKLLLSSTAKLLIKAGLLGKQKHARTTVYWAKAHTD